MKRIISTLFGLAVLCLFAEAQAVPTTVSFTGRLSTSAGPVSGNVNLVFNLYTQASGGSSVWTETRNGILANMGLVYVDLGATSTLDETDFGNGPLFLEITVAGEILSPRLPIQSVPYAIRSQAANTSDTLGAITPAEVVTNITGAGGISAVRTGNSFALTGSTTTGTAPIAVAGSAVSLTTCAGNQVYKMNAGGTAWACSADANTPPTATAPLTVAGVNVSLTNCAGNQVYKMNAGGTAWACAADSADIPPTATAPLSVSGVNVSLTNCAANQVYKMNAGGTAWGCAADDNTGTTYTNGSGLTLTSGTFATDNTVVARKDSAAGNQAFDTSTLFLDYGNNRVGVNTAAPGAGFALDVSGSTRSGGYGFSATQTGYYFVPGSVFTSDTDDDMWETSTTTGYGYVGGSTAPYDIAIGAPVNLPNGVTVTQLLCYTVDSSSWDLSGTMSLRSKTLSNGSASTVTSVSYATTGTPGYETKTGPVVAIVVDNNTNGYFLSSTVTATGTTPFIPAFHGCRITYTYTTVTL